MAGDHQNHRSPRPGACPPGAFSLLPTLATTRTSYSPLELARLLGVSPQTVQRWVDAGHVEAWKTPGGHRRIDVASAERLIDARRAAAAATAAVADQHGTAAASPVVVVADDNDVDRELLVRAVRRALPRARVETARNGFQALVTIGRVSPVLVVTDLRMPHMNGFELVRQLVNGTVPGLRAVVAVSALTREDLAALGPLVPGVDFLPKPVNLARFIDLVHNRLGATGVTR